jgi:hypothetical protein
MPLTAEQAVAKVEKLHGELANRRPAIALADEYYRGRQPLKFASEKWREYNAGRYRDFSDNWCAPVANTPNERLRVDGFRLDENPDISDAEKGLWRDWQANLMDVQSSQGFLQSITAARSSVIVWGDDDDNPVATWERPDQTVVGYDPEFPMRRVAALKTWCDDATEYATLYLPDEVWKFERDNVRVSTPTDTTGYPRAGTFFETTSGLAVPSVGRSGWKLREVAGPNPMSNPMGEVPVVEFANRPTLGDGPISEISGTIAMQDAINLLWAYLFAAADFASMPARVVMGQEPPKIPILDEAGQKVGEREVDLKKLANDRILWLTGQNTKVSQWDAAKLDAFTGVIETAVTHIAAQTRTPPHLMVLGKGLVNVSAEGMKAAETGLVSKVLEEQLFFGAATREVFRLMALVRNDKGMADQCRFGAVQWKDAENHSEAQLVDALQKLSAIGFPFRWIAERYGLSQTEVLRLLEMRDAEMASDPIAALARQQAAGPQPGTLPAGA